MINVLRSLGAEAPPTGTSFSREGLIIYVLRNLGAEAPPTGTGFSRDRPAKADIWAGLDSCYGLV